MPKMLVTGASGFVGGALCQVLREAGIAFIPVVRRPMASADDSVLVADIGAATDWTAALLGVTTVVHLAARVHVLNDSSLDPLAEYRRANVGATVNLARQCARSGVKRFVYLSSLKVNGESSPVRPFIASDPPAPSDPYGISKWEAEQALRCIEQETGLEVVVIRPPLVYGPGVKANFLSLMRAVRRGIPLPLASVTANRRSMIFVGNLVDLILCCARHPEAASRTFLASDGHDLSTAELIQSLAVCMGKRAASFPVPPALLRVAASVIGKNTIMERLLGSLQVDIQFTKKTLGWSPPYLFQNGIEQTVKHFLAN